MTVRIAFDNSYTRLPERFYARLPPTPVAKPELLLLNRPLAIELGLDPEGLSSEEGLAILAGQRAPEGAASIALAYAGHQFGSFSPQLGDGRALLLGEVIDRNGRRRDIQLKGSGPTPFSRRGDGRAALGPVLREYLVSEAFHAYGVPTTRALAAVSTGEPVLRDDVLPGAVLTRVAASHIRVGTFQFFAARGDAEAVRLLADHVIERHYGEARAAEKPVLAMLEGVIARQAALIARWLGLGFVHGVMNTDNMSIAGETIDFGPCAFLDAYHPGAVFSSIDQMARYAYGAQPRIAQWNLARLAETLLPLIDADETRAVELASEAVNGFAPAFNAAYVATFGAKLGLSSPSEEDLPLIADLLVTMAENEADFTRTFRLLADAAVEPHANALRAQFAKPVAIDPWLERWRDRLGPETPDAAKTRRARMAAANPAYIPRNHHVEAALEAAQTGDLGPFRRLADALAAPFEERPGLEAYLTSPRPPTAPYRTFCGT